MVEAEPFPVLSIHGGVNMAGAGTHLHKMIYDWTGEKPSVGCSCAAWIKMMDTQGPAWCRKNLKKIAAKLLAEARERAVAWRAVPVDETGTLLNTLRQKAWKGAFLLPGSGILLKVFVRRMVLAAIVAAEKDG